MTQGGSSVALVAGAGVLASAHSRDEVSAMVHKHTENAKVKLNAVAAFSKVAKFATQDDGQPAKSSTMDHGHIVISDSFSQSLSPNKPRLTVPWSSGLDKAQLQSPTSLGPADASPGRNGSGSLVLPALVLTPREAESKFPKVMP